jgi:hypothetical protein
VWRIPIQARYCSCKDGHLLPAVITNHPDLQAHCCCFRCQGHLLHLQGGSSTHAITVLEDTFKKYTQALEVKQPVEQHQSPVRSKHTSRVLHPQVPGCLGAQPAQAPPSKLGIHMSFTKATTQPYHFGAVSCNLLCNGLTTVPHSSAAPA